jgi:hypothetical protein
MLVIGKSTADTGESWDSALPSRRFQKSQGPAAYLFYRNQPAG